MLFVVIFTVSVILIVVGCRKAAGSTTDETAAQEITTDESNITETTEVETAIDKFTTDDTTEVETTAVETTAKGKIAFGSNRDGNWEIYIMNIDGSGQVNLTNNKYGNNENSPCFSPDGSKIAFQTSRDGNPEGAANDEIYIMNIDGSEQTNLTNNPIGDYDGEPLFTLRR